MFTKSDFPRRLYQSHRGLSMMCIFTKTHIFYTIVGILLPMGQCNFKSTASYWRGKIMLFTKNFGFSKQIEKIAIPTWSSRKGLPHGTWHCPKQCMFRGKRPKEKDESIIYCFSHVYLFVMMPPLQGRFTWGPKSQVPLMSTSPNMEAKSQLLSLTIPLTHGTGFRSTLFYVNKFSGLMLSWVYFFCLTQLSTQVPSITSKDYCHVDIHVILGTQDLEPLAKW